MSFGVQRTGYARTPLAEFLAAIEERMIARFGQGVIQTPQSPFGQFNGLAADLQAEIDERNLDLYQSYDPDEAEGTRLQTLAKIRLLEQGDLSEEDFRRIITNEDATNFELADFEGKLRTLTGVTYAQVWINDAQNIHYPNATPGSLTVVVHGGDENDIASVIQQYTAPGVVTEGDRLVTTTRDGHCKTYLMVRPAIVDLNLEITARRFSAENGCPAPSKNSVALAAQTEWLRTRRNGQSPDFFSIRRAVEKQIEGVEVISVRWYEMNTPDVINPNLQFTQLASISLQDIIVTDS